jgi:hypothetical protein
MAAAAVPTANHPTPVTPDDEFTFEDALRELEENI